MLNFHAIFDEIIEEMKELYLQDTLEWCLMVSMGKDSSLMLLLVWKMLESLPDDLRQKKVHVVTSDTLVETPMMTEFAKNGLEGIRRASKEQGLPIVVHTAQPRMKDRFFLQGSREGCNSYLSTYPLQMVYRQDEDQSYQSYSERHHHESRNHCVWF